LPLFFVFLAGCAGLSPVPAGSLKVGLLGDTPYSRSEVQRLDQLIDELNAQDLAFVVHVGDITSGSGPCTDEWFEARKRQFARLRAPFVLLPGDNDWTDCHKTGFDPIERLRKWRSIFCSRLSSIPFEVQQGEYCEHVRWEAGGVMFVALNVPGSNNNLGRTPVMDAEHDRRMLAVFQWLDDTFAVAESRGLSRAVVLMQADPFERHTPDGFQRLRNALATAAKWFKGKLVLVHGDGHVYQDDEPIRGLRRVEVPGSPVVGWLRASILPDLLRIERGGSR
jgi:hypothetical protein